jgi:hypothetical protein
VSVLSSATVVRRVDSVAVVLGQAYQLARGRLASAASPVLRLLMQRDQAITETDLLRREVAILRSQREGIAPHRRPDYEPSQRLAILQLRRLRGWKVIHIAERFVLHPNTVRSWISAAEGGKKTRLFADALSWNRIDDAVRWAVQEIRRFCPEPEFGTRTIARHLIRAGIAISRSTVQRVLREEPPKASSTNKHPAMAEPLGQEPDHLLTPTEPNRVWHLDFTCLRILCWQFTLAAVLDGFSRKLLCLRLNCHRPRSTDVICLLRGLIATFGKPHFLITDHGCQFRKRFSAVVKHPSRAWESANALFERKNRAGISDFSPMVARGADRFVGSEHPATPQRLPALVQPLPSAQCSRWDDTRRGVGRRGRAAAATIPRLRRVQAAHCGATAAVARRSAAASVADSGSPRRLTLATYSVEKERRAASARHGPHRSS